MFMPFLFVRIKNLLLIKNSQDVKYPWWF